MGLFSRPKAKPKQPRKGLQAIKPSVKPTANPRRTKLEQQSVQPSANPVKKSKPASAGSIQSQVGDDNKSGSGNQNRQNVEHLPKDDKITSQGRKSKSEKLRHQTTSQTILGQQSSERNLGPNSENKEVKAKADLKGNRIPTK